MSEGDTAAEAEGAEPLEDAPELCSDAQQRRRIEDLEALTRSLTQSLSIATDRAEGGERLLDELRVRGHVLRSELDNARSSEAAVKGRYGLLLRGLTRKLSAIEEIADRPWRSVDPTTDIAKVCHEP